MDLLISTLFITCVGTVTLTLTGWCTDLLGEWSSIYAQLISQKFLHRALSLIHSKIVQHILVFMLDSLGISSLGFRTIICPNGFLVKEMVSKLYGCMFPGSPCHTQTETNGNTPCSLILPIYFSMLLVTIHAGMYK